MTLIWREQWALGIDLLDRDHRALVDLYNEIANGFGDEGTAPEAERASALERLDREVRAHFEREEAFMRGIEYSDWPRHKREHELLLAELRVLLREHVQRGRLDADGLDALKHWLMAHVLGIDRAFAEHYFEGVLGRSGADAAIGTPPTTASR